MIRRLLKKKYKLSNFRPKEMLANMKWEFHKADADCNPSVPHGHSLEGNYKLSIWDGTVYKIEAGKLSECGKAKKKEMRVLQKDPKFREFVLESRKWYMENYPLIQLPPLKDEKSTISNTSRKCSFGKKVPEKIYLNIEVSFYR